MKEIIKKELCRKIYVLTFSHNYSGFLGNILWILYNVLVRKGPRFIF